MPTWSVDPTSPTPPSRQLVETTLDHITNHLLHPGDQLPSVRRLAADARVNHNTVARAYRDLEALGVLRGENGRGSFLTPQAPAVARRERNASTLAAFRAATLDALRAGHTPASLEREFRFLQQESA